MANVILRIVGAIGFALTLGVALDAGAVASGMMGGFIYLLFSSTNNDD